MIRICLETRIAAPIELVFDLARDIGVHHATVWPHTREKAVGGVTGGLIGPGQTVTLEATHFGVRQRLTAEVVEYERPYVLVDQMRSGAFASMRHEHRFREEDGLTVMTDLLEFAAPLGLLGRLAEQLVLKRYMTRFLRFRSAGLKRLAEQRCR